MNVIISLSICLIITLIPSFELIKKYKEYDVNKKGKFKDFVILNKNQLICIVIIFIACLCRTIKIDRYPAYFNQDEVSIGYEANSILNYGVDRNGMSYPIHLISWGSGQNALYAYILIPFIKLLGMNVFSIRLPMAIISCISVIVWYYLLKMNLKEYNKKFIMMLSIFSLFPGFILKARWALESNIFPDIILYATFFINKYILNKKKRFLYLALFFIGISSYSYGTSYLFLPLYCVIMFGYLLKKKYINIKQSIIPIFFLIVIVLPMLLFTIINYFDLDTIKFGKLTIPKMVTSRLHESSIRSDNFIHDLVSILITNYHVIVYQLDVNNILNFSLFSIISSTIASVYFFLYLFKYRKKEEFNLLDEIMFIWLIASIITVMFFGFRVILYVQRINIFLIPYLYFSIKGILKSKIIKPKFLVIIFLLFIIEYFTIYDIFISGYEDDDFEKSLEFVQSINDDNSNVYIQYNVVHEAYIYYLYYNEINPIYYNLNSDKYIVKSTFWTGERVTRIGNVYFSEIEDIKDDGIIIIDKKYIDDFTSYKVKEFGDIVVIYK